MRFNQKKAKALKIKLNKKFKSELLPNLANDLYHLARFDHKILEQLIDQSFKRDSLMNYLAKRMRFENLTLNDTERIRYHLKVYLIDKKIFSKTYENTLKDQQNKKEYYDDLISKLSKQEIIKILNSNDENDQEIKRELLQRDYHLYIYDQ